VGLTSTIVQPADPHEHLLFPLAHLTIINPPPLGSISPGTGGPPNVGIKTATSPQVDAVCFYSTSFKPVNTHAPHPIIPWLGRIFRSSQSISTFQQNAPWWHHFTLAWTLAQHPVGTAARLSDNNVSGPPQHLTPQSTQPSSNPSTRLHDAYHHHSPKATKWCLTQSYTTTDVKIEKHIPGCGKKHTADPILTMFLATGGPPSTTGSVFACSDVKSAFLSVRHSAVGMRNLGSVRGPGFVTTAKREGVENQPMIAPFRSCLRWRRTRRKGERGRQRKPPPTGFQTDHTRAYRPPRLAGQLKRSRHCLSPLRVAHSHHCAARENRRHMPRVSRDSPTTLRTGKRTATPDPLEVNVWGGRRRDAGRRTPMGSKRGQQAGALVPWDAVYRSASSRIAAKKQVKSD
jgi:hypothetical protein